MFCHFQVVPKEWNKMRLSIIKKGVYLFLSIPEKHVDPRLLNPAQQQVTASHSHAFQSPQLNNTNISKSFAKRLVQRENMQLLSLPGRSVFNVLNNWFKGPSVKDWTRYTSELASQDALTINRNTQDTFRSFLIMHTVSIFFVLLFILFICFYFELNKHSTTVKYNRKSYYLRRLA